MTTEWGPASIAVEDGTVTLPDGRHLGYIEYGERSAPPLLLFPGSGGSRYYNPSVSAEPAVPVRLFTIERPGFGRSDMQPGRTLRDWARDVVGFADALGLERFAIVGYSRGGPHALACGAEIPERLTRIGVVSGIAPDAELYDFMDEDERTLVASAGDDPVAAVRTYLAGLDPIEDPTAFLRGPLPEVERQFLDDPRTREMYEASLREHYMPQGEEGDAWEVIATNADAWGFALSEIATPVHVWHGRLDQIALPAHADYLNEHLPNVETTFWPDEGHVGILARWPEVVAALVG